MGEWEKEGSDGRGRDGKERVMGEGEREGRREGREEEGRVRKGE